MKKEKITKKCLCCNQYYEGRGQFYCSHKCSQKHRWKIGELKGHKPSKDTKEKIRQSNLGKKRSNQTKDRLKLAWVKRKEKGLGIAWNKNKKCPREKNLINRICQNCSKNFQVANYRVQNGNGKYCSMECVYVGIQKNPTQKMIEHRKKAQKIMAQSRIGMKHTLKTRIGISIKKQKIKSEKWTGFLKSIHHRIRNSGEYKQWRTKNHERDNYTCYKCKQRGGRLHVHHHIIPFSKILNSLKQWCDEFNLDLYESALKFKPLWDINNGQTLCKKCHKKTDDYLNPYYYGKY